MIGIDQIEPNTPGLVMVKVPPCTSSSVSVFSRARRPRSSSSRATPTKLFWSASLMTGTVRPSSSATPTPMFTRPRSRMPSSVQWELTMEKARSAAAAARTKNAV